MDSADLEGIVPDIMRIKSVKMQAVKCLNVIYDIPESAGTLKTTPTASSEPFASIHMKKIKREKPLKCLRNK